MDELITAGGELAFVTAMVRDSLQLRDRVGTQSDITLLWMIQAWYTYRELIHSATVINVQVRWYTTMVGKKVTLRRVLGVLREAGIHNVRTTEFLQVPHRPHTT